MDGLASRADTAVGTRSRMVVVVTAVTVDPGPMTEVVAGIAGKDAGEMEIVVGMTITSLVATVDVVGMTIVSPVVRATRIVLGETTVGHGVAVKDAMVAGMTATTVGAVTVAGKIIAMTVVTTTAAARATTGVVTARHVAIVAGTRTVRTAAGNSASRIARTSGAARGMTVAMNTVMTVATVVLLAMALLRRR